MWSFGTWTYHNLIIEICRSQSLVLIFNILLYVKLIKIKGVFLAGCAIATLYLMTTFQTLKTTTCIIILQFICSSMAGHLCDANVVSLCDKQSWMVVVCWTINVKYMYSSCCWKSAGNYCQLPQTKITSQSLFSSVSKYFSPGAFCTKHELTSWQLNY